MGKTKPCLPGYQGQNYQGFANLFLIALEGLRDPRCEVLPKEIRERLDGVIELLTEPVEKPNCWEDWINILSIENPTNLVRMSKVQLEKCLSRDCFMNCKCIGSLLTDELAIMLGQ